MNEYTANWVFSPAAGACYWANWGGSSNGRFGGQPCADLSKPEWRAELTRAMRLWVIDRKIDGFMLDAPPDYLAVETGKDVELHSDVIASLVRSVMVEPMHALGAAVFAETYNFLVPTITKMIDGGRNTDLGGHGAKVINGFQTKLSNMIKKRDATRLEDMLQATVDVHVSWTGMARVQPDYSKNDPASVAGIKAAVTALLGGYYVVRKGSDCSSPLGPGYGPSPSGNLWPGGCPGSWKGERLVTRTLKSLRKSHALRPNSPRRAFTSLGGGKAVYAALRTSASDNGDAAVLLFNLSRRSKVVTIDFLELDAFGISRPQTPLDLINDIDGPRIGGTGPWSVTLKPLGWAVYDVKLK